MQTQVRIPEFNVEDEEMQFRQTSSMIYPTTTETVTTPRTKRRQQLIENSANTVSTDIENKRMQASNRVAAKRAQATPEEGER